MKGWHKEDDALVKVLGKGFDGDLKAVVRKLGEGEWSWSIETKVNGEFILTTASNVHLLRRSDAQRAALQFAALYSEPLHPDASVGTDPETLRPDLTRPQQNLLRYLALYSEDDHHVIHGARIATALALVRAGLAAEKPWIGSGRLFRLTESGTALAGK